MIEARVLQAGRVVAGIVSGADGAQKHRVYIRRVPAADGGIGEGECSCGARVPCVHIAAVSIAACTGTRVSAQVQRSIPAMVPTKSLTTVSGQRLYYVLRASPAQSIGELGLSIWVSQTAPGGQPDPVGACPFALRAANVAEFPRYVDAQDRSVLRVLLAESTDGSWLMRAAAGVELLQRVLPTRRAHWESLEGPRLRAGDARRVAFAWSILPSGEQWLSADASGSIRTLLDLDPPQYIDTATGESGMLELPCSAALLAQLMGRGAIAPEQVGAVNAQLVSAAAQLPPLRTLSVERQPCDSLAPKLILSAAGEPRLYFLYNGLAIDDRRLQAAEACVRQVLGNVIHEIVRDREAEQRFRLQLMQVLPSAAHRDAWLAFQMQSLPPLRDAGWQIEVEARFPYRIAPADDWYADVQHDARDPWFSLRLGVMVEGRHVNLLPGLVRYLEASMQSEGEPGLVRDEDECCRSGDHWFVPLDDGRYVPIPIERMERIAHTLVELFDRDSLDARGRLTLPKTQAARLAQLQREVPLLCSDEPSLGALVERLATFSGIERLPAPREFRATLRTYQEEGLGWLQFLRCYGFGGILADDMGLGKTVQTLAHLTLEKAHGRLRKPALIVAPVSAIGNWRAEIERFAPTLKGLILHGARRRESFHSIDTADVVVIGYPSLQLDLELLLQREFSVVILDEAQTIKNPRAKVAQAARALRTEHRLCLTGTPMENHLGELWSLCDFLQPGLLGEERQFQRHYRTPIEKHGDKQRARALAARIAPFLLRRTKDAVAKELPPKTEIIEPIVLDDRQRDLYDGVRLAMHRRIRELVATRGLARSQITILDALLQLRQVCCDPRLASADAAHDQIPSAKLDWLAAALPELIAEGRRILLFSQFTSMLQLIEPLLRERGIPYCLLTGNTQRREEVVERFQSGAAPVFLISLKAGGTALNLTAADTVIHYDPWWNPAVEAQATDRAHRIGQNQPVFVYKLIAQGTVEERMVQMQIEKRALAGQLYDARNASPLSLSAADLEMLFAP